jgi:predicted metal-dependent hydrolase
MRLWKRHSSRSDIQSQKEPSEYSFKQWKVVIVRQAYRRRISIYLKPDQPIRVVAPRSMPFSEIEDFVQSREKWIEKHMHRYTEHLAELRRKFPEKKLLQSENFPFLGKDLELKFEKTSLKTPFFTRDETHLRLHVPEALWEELDEESLQQFWPELGDFYKREAEKLISERIQIWSGQMDLHPSVVRFRNQKTRWGSCSHRGNININWRLIGAPLEVVDYILVHELAHLKHMNHSEQFWKLVETHFPNYRDCEKWLDENHAALDFLLKTKSDAQAND